MKNADIFISQSGLDFDVDVSLEEHYDIDVVLEGTVIMQPGDIEPQIKEYLENPNDLTTIFIGNNEISPTAYTHVQAVASATWNINHNLNRADVVIKVFNSSHVEVLAEVENIDADNSVVRFAFPVAGTAECR